MHTLVTEPQTWWYNGSENLLAVLARLLQWDLTLVQAYSNLQGSVIAPHLWDKGVMRINLSQRADGHDPQQVWMLYHNEVSSNKGLQLAHFHVLRRSHLVLEPNAVTPLLVGAPHQRLSARTA